MSITGILPVSSILGLKLSLKLSSEEAKKQHMGETPMRLMGKMPMLRCGVEHEIQGR